MAVPFILYKRFTNIIILQKVFNKILTAPKKLAI
jgi:hypothetical protein